ncbi:MAG: MBL fold metallo-hydrolase [Deltaproteobacteria bacterium]|nr:MBL fold metallo-hydrolase [Deltaproteobacteria bacterium]
MRWRGVVTDGVYMVGGPDISNVGDAASFIVDFNGELIMIDSGTGFKPQIIESNIHELGFDPHNISTLILTHCHFDHIGGAPYFREKYGCRILTHEIDSVAIERGDYIKTAAKWHNVKLEPLEIDEKLTGESAFMPFNGDGLHWLHTPGHTPGSICLYTDRGGRRILFGQDMHGPVKKYYRSDVNQWEKSMEMLLGLEADILCEGHYGIFEPKDKVVRYIKRCLRIQSRREAVNHPPDGWYRLTD